MPTHSQHNQAGGTPLAAGLSFTVEQMRRVDAYCIEQLGLPGIVLMEHAAIALRRELREWPERPVIVLVGPGNNGGDGLALARLLHLEQPARSICCVLLGGKELGGDAGVNLRVLRRLAEHGSDALSIREELPGEWPDHPADSGIVVDAMFGSGLSRPLESRFAAAVKWIAEQRKKGSRVLAVDVPSGMDADTGQPVRGDDGSVSPIVEADLTVTLGGMKVGLLKAESSAWSGEVRIGDIGAPRWVLERYGQPIEQNAQG